MFSYNLFLRFISSIFLIILVILFNYLGSYYLLLLSIVTFSLLLIEYYRLFDLQLLKLGFFINLLLILINFLLIYSNFILIPILITFFGIFFGLVNSYKYLVPVSSYFYLALPFYILIYLNTYYVDGKIFIFWLFSIVWASDSSAYICGSIIKGKKFFPSISPNKTWAGFFFSLIFSVISSSVFSFYFNIIDIYQAISGGLLIGLFTAFGDLFESYLKRINNKKDSSKLIPGHGGILDRLDGFLFAIVVMFIFILLWSNR